MTSFLQIARNLSDRIDGSSLTTIYNSDVTALSQTVRRYREHINLAYNMVKLALNRTDEYRQTSTTFTTVSGTESYIIPSDILNIDQVQIGTDPPLDVIPWGEYETYKRQFLTVTDTGYPSVCAIYERQIWFYPTPDAVMTVNIRGQEILADLDLDTDEPDLPEEYHRVIQELAIHLEMLYEGNPNAGVLSAGENGALVGQGGQAAIAVNLFNLVRRNSGDHIQQSPRRMSRYEAQNKNALRRVIY